MRKIMVFMMLTVLLCSTVVIAQSGGSAQPAEMLNFFQLIKNARKAAEKDQPQRALDFFQKALIIAHSQAEKRVALFGVANMQLWLEHYRQAEKNYRQLLSQVLSAEDKQVALNGLVRSINYQGKPKEAYQLIPIHFQYQNPSLLLAVAGAYVADHKVEKAEHLLRKNHLLIAGIDKSSRLNKELSQLNKNILNIKKSRMIQRKKLRYQKMLKQQLVLGNRYFEQNKLKLALKVYNNALIMTKNENDHQAVLFRIASVYLANEQYSKSLAIYKTLLSAKLNRGDYEVALNGYVRSLSALDEPMKAYLAMPHDFKYTLPTTVIGVARAAAWSGWAYKAKYLLKQNASLLSRVTSKSYLYRQLNDIIFETDSVTDTNAVGYNNYFESDNEGFNIQRHQVQYARRFNSAVNTTFFVNENQYSAPMFSTIHATIANVKSEGLLNNFLYYQANIGEETYGNWHAFLWKSNLIFTPNDFLSMGINNRKEIVESMQSLVNYVSQIDSDAYIAIHPIYRAMVSGDIFYTEYSDSNIREGSVLKVVYLLFPTAGLYAEGLVREYSDTMHSQNYFSPDEYSEQRISLRLRRRFFLTHMRYYLLAGFGRQQINEDMYTPTRNYEIGLDTPFAKNLSFRAFFGYSDLVADNAIQSAGYARKYGGVSLTCAFE